MIKINHKLYISFQVSDEDEVNEDEVLRYYACTSAPTPETATCGRQKDDKLRGKEMCQRET